MNQATHRVSFLLSLLCLSFSTRADGFFDVELSNGKYGIVFTEGYNKKTKWVVDPVYDSIIDKNAHQNPWNKGDKDLTRFFYMLYKKGEVGVFRHGTGGSGDWEMVLKCQFEKVVMAKGMCAVKKAGKWGLFDGFKATWLLQPEYDNVEVDRYATEFAFNATATKNGKTGLYDIQSQTWVLPMEYDEAIIIGNNSVSTRLGQQRGIYYSKTYDQPYRYWLVPQGPYDAINYTVPQTGNFLVDSAGKKGLWQSYPEVGPKSMCLIPAHYNNLLRVDKIHFFTDSLGKMGLWRIERKQWKSSSPLMLLPAVYDELFVNTNDDITAKQGEQIGVFGLSSGWKTRMNASSGKQRIYSLFGQTLTISHKPGIGFHIDSDASGAIQTLEIPDKNPYDSFGLVSGNLLAAFKGGLSNIYYLHFVKGRKDVLTGSQLLAEGVDFCCLTYPPKENQQWKLIESQALVYRSKGIVSWHNVGALGSKPQVLTKVAIAVDDVDDFFIKNPDSAFGKPLMLVMYKKKYGIVTTDGQVLAPIVHPSFKIINNHKLRFQSPIPGKFRLFDVKEAGMLSLQTMDTEWGGLTWATVNGKKKGDFDSIARPRLPDIYKIDTGWYYINNHQAKHTRVLFEGDIIEGFTQGSHRYEVIEKSTGLGLTRDGQILVPATMASINKVNGSLTMVDNRNQLLSLPLTALDGNFDPVKGYTYYDADKKCKVCKGARGAQTLVSTTTPGSTTYSTKEVLVDKPTADLNGRKTSIQYETTAKTTKASTRTYKTWVPCNTCKGKGNIPGDVTYKLNKGVFQID